MQKSFTDVTNNKQGIFSSTMTTSGSDIPQNLQLVKYVSIHEIFPAQTRCSSQNTAEKVDKALASGAAVWNASKNDWEFKYHHGTSIFSRNKAVPVVKASFGYVLIDGHHDVLSSIKLHADMVPVKIVEDLSQLTPDQFWEVAEQKGWAYLYTADGKKTLPLKSFADMSDDTNRYFAAITARKYFSDNSGAYTSIGAEYPLWIKVNKDIPFIEFKISNALFGKGFIYDPQTMGNPPKDEVIEQARQIILQANIPGLRIVRTRMHYDQIDLNRDDLGAANNYSPARIR